jgi:hypothetical protein
MADEIRYDVSSTCTDSPSYFGLLFILLFMVKAIWETLSCELSCVEGFN